MLSTVKLKPGLTLIIGAVMISFSSVLVHTSHVTPMVSAFYRAFFGGLFLLAAAFFKKDLTSRGTKNNLLAVVCGLFFAADLGAWHISIHFIGPGLATILANFQVFILTLFGIIFLKETLNLAFLISVPAAFLGLFLLVGLDQGTLSENYMAGIFWGLATAVFYSIFLLLVRHLQSDPDHFSLFYYQMLFSLSSAGFLFIAARINNESFMIPDFQTLSSLVTLGVVIQGLAWILITSVLPKVNASHAGLVLLLQPSLSFVWDVWFFDRPTGFTGWIGFFIVLIAIYFGMGHKQVKK